ncbi:MAG: 30S ribosomal protein S1 [Anaerolineae bacterium]|jgi:small subunit ribosomal protein S1
MASQTSDTTDLTATDQEEQQEATAQQDQFAAMLEADYDYERLRRGEIREATIVLIEENEVIVDLGVKRDGIVSQRDLDRLSEEVLGGLHVGDTVPVSILNTSNRQDGILVSLRQGLAQQDWLRAERVMESGEICEAEVNETNRGGVVVQFGRVRGFVPNSHLTSVRRGLSKDRLHEAKEELVGKMLQLAVIEVDRRRRRLVLSERIATQQRREQLLEEITVGEVRTGVVCNIVSYGAFVDLGGIDGLVHISELDWQHIGHPSEVLKLGDDIEVYVLNVDRERNRIGLSRKRLLPDPWPLVTEQLNEGDLIEGTVTNTVDFGAFVEVGQGVEGLVHISQIPGGQNALGALQRDEKLQVRVLRVDPWKRRISLSLYGTMDLAQDGEETA